MNLNLIVTRSRSNRENIKYARCMLMRTILSTRAVLCTVTHSEVEVGNNKSDRRVELSSTSVLSLLCTIEPRGCGETTARLHPPTSRRGSMKVQELVKVLSGR